MQHVLAVSNWLESPIRSLVKSIVNTLKSMRESIERARRINETVKELGALSDSELKDIGIHRSQIVSIAYDDVYGLDR